MPEKGNPRVVLEYKEAPLRVFWFKLPLDTNMTKASYPTIVERSQRFRLQTPPLVRAASKTNESATNHMSGSPLPTDTETSGKSPGDLFESLPLELQTEIFVVAVHPLTSLSSYSLPRPTILSQVCKAWRSVALSAPIIWSSFAFELPREADISVSRRTQIINRMLYWLERSRYHPLDFALTQERSVRDRSQQELAEVLLSILLSHSRRWRHVRVSIWSGDLANALNDGGRRFPLLRSLTIDPIVSKTQLPFSFKSLDGAWSQLSTVHLVNYRHPPPIDQILGILSLAANVKNFTANTLCDSISPRYEQGGIRLPNLTHLRFIFQYVDGIPRPKAVFEEVIRNCLLLLASLSMNALQSFYIEWDVVCNDNQCIQLGSPASRTLVSFFQAIGSTLEELGLLYLPVGVETLLGCFAHIPFVRDLQLKYSLADNEPTPVNDRLLGALGCSNGQDSFVGSLPRLTNVKLETHGRSLTSESLARFVKSRMEERRDSRLRRLDLVTQQRLYDHFPPELTNFRHQLNIFSNVVH